jgi:hypothetical protein
MPGLHAVGGSFSTSQEGLAENSSSTSSDGISSNPTSYAARDDDICTEADGEPCHISSVSSSCEDEHRADLLLENEGATTSPYILSDDDLGGPQNDENTGQQEEEGAEEAMSDLESQPENAWEPDSTSQSQGCHQAQANNNELSQYESVETVWLRWSDLLVARMWILCKELCSSQTHVT